MGSLFSSGPTIKLRKPCDCGSDVGVLVRSGPHWRVNCEQCDRYQYFERKAAIESPSPSEPRSYREIHEEFGVCQSCGDAAGLVMKDGRRFCGPDCLREANA